MFTPASGMLAMQIGGLLTSGIGAYSSIQSQRSMLDTQAAIADANARISEIGAQSALSAGQQQVASLTMRAGALKSGQRAQMAANGIDLGVGSAAEVLASTDIMKEIDANTTTANATRAAWGFRTQATSAQIDALTKRASAGSMNPALAAGTSLLGGAGGVAEKWYMFNRMAGGGGSADAMPSGSSVFSSGGVL